MSQDLQQEVEFRKCKNCQEKGALVGEIVLGYINKSTQQIRDGNRVIFMLAGLNAVYLEGIVGKLPKLVNNKSIHLRIHPEVSDQLTVEEEFLSTESATHWRHFDGSDIIVFAPTDLERNRIGSSLCPISVIDENLIVNEIDGWVSLLGASELQNNYLVSALKGLRDSEIYIDLDRWVDFVFSIKKQGFSDPVNTRINKAAPALHIPIHGITELPRFNREQITPSHDKFKKAFELAKNQVGVYVGLFTPKHERVIIEEIQDSIDSFEVGNSHELKESLKIVQNLINDANQIRPGTWLQSQRDFCEKVNWGEVGSKIFTGKSKPRTSNIGEPTLNYLKGNFNEDLEVEEEDYLNEMGRNTFSPNPELEARFFEKWKERLYNAPDIRLYKVWQGRVFRKEVSGQDLIILLLDSIEALFKTGEEALEEIDAPCVLVRSTHPNKADYWEGKDHEILKLFQFELGSIYNHLGQNVSFQLDECFEIEHGNSVITKEGRTVDLELYLIDKSKLEDTKDDKRILNNVPRIKSTWQPGKQVKLEPITLSLVKDFEDLKKARENKLGLFSFNTITLLEGSKSPITLHDRNSFYDVTGGGSGRVFQVSKDQRQDIIHSIRHELNKSLDDKLVKQSVVEKITSSLNEFMKYYSKAIDKISDKPWEGKGYGSKSILKQAIAFGIFCNSCRNQDLEYNLKRKLQSYVARIGIIFSDENSAIITPWHPFRLAEKQSKIFALSEFIKGVLSSSHESDISMEFGDLRKKLTSWTFPEITYYEDNTFISIDSLGGYSLLTPADCTSRNQEALEISAGEAAHYFIKAVDQYLEIHPHEAANLSISIYFSESESLPSKVSDLLASRFHKDKDLRCDLIISHRDQVRLQEIFRNQNRILRTGEIGDNVKAILTRLRVDVRSHKHTSGSEEVRDVDLLFLHESISKYSHNSWETLQPESDQIINNFEIAYVDIPRRMITEDGINNSIIYHTCPKLPEPINEYHGMLYELDKQVNLPDGKQAHFLSRINANRTEVKQLIEEAHNIANWVVTFDRSISRRVLEQNHIKIIQDISIPDAESRVIISASKIEEELEENLTSKITNTCQIPSQDSQKIANFVMEDIMSIAGQKLLAAIRNDNVLNEILGLCLLKSRLLASLPENTNPIWISLDDFHNWITSGKGKIADLLGISVSENEKGFNVYIQVGEAKFISKYSQANETKDAEKQVDLTLDNIRKSFIDNKNPINLKSWCARLERLLTSQEFQFSQIGDNEFRTKFLKSLRNAEVNFHICGDSVICLHNDDEMDKCEKNKTQHYLRTHVISRYKIKSHLLQFLDGSIPTYPELKDVSWYSGETYPVNGKGENLDDGKVETKPTPLPKPSDQIDEVEKPGHENKEIEPKPLSELIPDPLQVNSIIPKPVLEVLKTISNENNEDFKDKDSVEWAEKICSDTQKALSDFGIRAEFADDDKFRLTPNGVLVTFKGNYTLTLKSAEAKKSELLTTYGLEVSDILPGTGSITFFIKREKRSLVPLGNSLIRFQPREETSEDNFFNLLIGSLEDEDGNLPLNLKGEFAGFDQHAPHTLIAGETGSGKGVLIQNLLLQLITFNHPDNLELYLIDPKMGVDFIWLENAPHLKQPIITDPTKAEQILSTLVSIMDKRYQQLRTMRVNKIEDYNDKVDPKDRLPRIVLIHDEMGSWMAENDDYKKVVLSTASSLGMKARAAGIHLILITQRADKDAIPPKLRDNLGNRLCLRVNSKAGSELVLGCGGAERLLGKGHIACKFTNQNPPSGRNFFVAQVPYAEQDQITLIAESAINYWEGKGYNQSMDNYY